MLLLTGLFLIFLLGYSVVSVISGKISFEEKLPLSFGIGMGIITLLMFYISRLNVQLTPLNLILIPSLLILLVTLVFFRKKISKPQIKVDPKKMFSHVLIISGCLIILFLILPVFNKLRISVNSRAMVFPAVFVCLMIFGGIIFGKSRAVIYLIVSLLVFCCFGILATNVYWPVHDWDSMALYDFLGRLFYNFKSISFPKDLPLFSYYVSYPFLTSIAHAYVYLLGGDNPKFIYAFYYIGMILIFFSFLKKEANLIVALFFTLLLATTFIVLEQASSSYTNIPFAFYQMTGAFYLYRFLKYKRKENFLISSVCLGISAWTRAAAEPFFLACLITLFIFTPSWKKILFSLIFLTIYWSIGYPWQSYIKEAFGTRLYDAEWVSQITVNALEHYPANIFNFSALGLILKQLLIILSDFKLYGSGGIIFFLAVVFNLKKIAQEKILITLIVANVLLWVMFIFGHGVTCSFNFGWQILVRDSMTRVFMGIYPLLIFYAATTNFVKSALEMRRRANK